MIIHIDMDDTLVNFTAAYNAAREKNPEQIYPQSQYGFFANLELLPNAAFAVKYFQHRGHKVYFTTAPSVHNPMCYTEKRVSIEKHFGFDACINLMLIHDKSMVYGDVLIDDRVDSNGQDQFKGDFIHFGSEKFRDWLHVIAWFEFRYHTVKDGFAIAMLHAQNGNLDPLSRVLGMEGTP